jgi:hypothetical protein
VWLPLAINRQPLHIEKWSVGVNLVASFML